MSVSAMHYCMYGDVEVDILSQLVKTNVLEKTYRNLLLLKTLI